MGLIITGEKHVMSISVHNMIITDYKQKEEEQTTILNWKKNFKLGLQIKQNWGNITASKKNIIPNFSEDCQQTCEEMFNTLKEHSSLPKLRKENIYIESDLNTSHQKYMYDFLYDQEDIYEYYNNIFEERNNNNIHKFNSLIEVRQPNLPFAFTLENFDDILSEFCDDKDIQSLANLRFYIFNSSLENIKEDNLINFPNDDLFTIFSTTCTDSFSAKLIEEIQIKNSNHIISLLNSIVLTLTFFCKMSYNYILKYQMNEKLFLDCYIKRYKAFIEAAIHLNEQLENLNVIVNFLYEILFKDYPKNPKFSIYRLMIIIWHREVTNPLTDLKQDKNFLSIILKMFKRYLTVEVNQLYGCDVRFNKAKSQPQNTFTSEEKDLLLMDCQSDDGESFISNGNNYSYLFSNCNFDSFLSNNFGLGLVESKSSSILEDVYTFDFQAKYFLEQIPCILLDTICNEYSTFYINDSQFPISQSYQVFENNLVKIFEKFINDYFAKANKLSFIRYLRSQDFINSRLINRTRNRLIDTISKIILTQCEKEITMIFLDYISSNIFLEKDAEIYLKAFDSNHLQEQFLSLAKDSFNNDLIAEYSTLYFMRELTKGKNHLYLTIIETKEWIDEEFEMTRVSDKHVRKENKRRNILLDGGVYQDQLFNFTPNFSFQHILEIYGIEGIYNNNFSNQIDFKQIHKSNDNTMMQIEEMDTFPQTYDPNMNFNMEIEIDPGLELRRR